MSGHLIVGLVCLLCAALFAGLAVAGVVPDGALSTLDKVASVSALIVAIVAFANPFGGGATKAHTVGDVGGDGQIGSNVVVQGDNSPVTIGDLSTSAEQRFSNAVLSVRKEFIASFGSQAIAISGIEMTFPERFWDTVRPGETLAAYEERALVAYRDYLAALDQQAGLADVRDVVYRSHQRDLGHKPDIAGRFDDAFSALAEVAQHYRGSAGLRAALLHLASRTLSDEERTNEAQRLHAQHVADMRVSLAQSAGSFAMVIDAASDADIIRAALAAVGIDINYSAGADGWRASQQAAAAEQTKKAKALQTSQSTTTTFDPTKSTDPQELFGIAAQAYMVGDAATVVAAFQRALQLGNLPNELALFAQLSILRVEQPALFGSGLGVVVLRLDQGSAFGDAGLLVGDVIIAIDGEPLSDVPQIGAALAHAKTSATVTLIRNRAVIQQAVPGGRAAGVLATSLVMLASSQA